MVYPTFLAAIGDVAHPAWRASAVGVYRFWRDSGFAVGALLAGIVADVAGLRAAIWCVAGLTVASGLLVAGTIVPPAAGTRCSGPNTVFANRMSPPDPQTPPRAMRLTRETSVRFVPPASTLSSRSVAKNPIHRLSGDQNGDDP